MSSCKSQYLIVQLYFVSPGSWLAFNCQYFVRMLSRLNEAGVKTCPVCSEPLLLEQMGKYNNSSGMLGQRQGSSSISHGGDDGRSQYEYEMLEDINNPSFGQVGGNSLSTTSSPSQEQLEERVPSRGRRTTRRPQ
jgi:hypothetical protein